MALALLFATALLFTGFGLLISLIVQSPDMFLEGLSTLFSAFSQLGGTRFSLKKEFLREICGTVFSALFLLSDFYRAATTTPTVLLSIV
jgi:hypothetical protein